MVNAFMIVVTIVGVLLILLVSFYFLVFFSADEDKNMAWLPKFIVILGLSFAAFLVLVLPLDVANRSLNGGYDMPTLWQFLYLATAIMVVVIVPFAMFYYEAYEDEKTCCNQFFTATCYALVFTIAFGVLCAILYITIGWADVPYTMYLAKYYTGAGDPSTTTNSSQTTSIKVSVPVYVIGLLCLLGWMLFTIFAGIGLVALPLDLINDFRTRVRRPNAEERREIERDINARVDRLVKTAEEIDKMPEGRPKNKAKRLFETAVYVVTRDHEQFKIDSESKVLWTYVKLVMGILTFCLSLAWILQIILHDLADVSAWLNTLLIDLDNVFALFAIIFYGLFAYYLLWAAIKGCVRFGLQIPFIFRIHPMEPGKTLMSSFLFNTDMVMLLAIVVTQFTASTFSGYTNGTAVNSLFQTYVKHLRGIGPAWQVYLYILVVFMGLTLLYLIICPRRSAKKKTKEDVEDLLASKGIFGRSAI